MFWTKVHYQLVLNVDKSSKIVVQLDENKFVWKLVCVNSII